VVQRLSRDVQPPFDFAHLEHLKMTFSPSQDPDVTRIFPSDWRSTTIVALSLVASFSRTFSSMSVLINHFVVRAATPRWRH
jgi:hypothetical protein